MLYRPARLMEKAPAAGTSGDGTAPDDTGWYAERGVNDDGEEGTWYCERYLAVAFRACKQGEEAGVQGYIVPDYPQANLIPDLGNGGVWYDAQGALIEDLSAYVLTSIRFRSAGSPVVYAGNAVLNNFAYYVDGDMNASQGHINSPVAVKVISTLLALTCRWLRS